MPRLLAHALVVVLAVLTLTLVARAADPTPSAAPGITSAMSPGIMAPTAPSADFNQPAQSSSGLIQALHVRGPEKFIGAAVVLLLLVCVVMFAGMLRHVYGGPGSARP